MKLVYKTFKYIRQVSRKNLKNSRHSIIDLISVCIINGQSVAALDGYIVYV